MFHSIRVKKEKHWKMKYSLKNLVHLDGFRNTHILTYINSNKITKARM